MATLQRLYLFLSVSVNKGDDDNRSSDNFWSKEEELSLISGITEAETVILNPNTIAIPKSKYYERFCADLNMMLQSDVVIVDARTKKGIGVGAEMVIAKQEGIPVYALCPVDSHYRKQDSGVDNTLREWIHPFVYGLSDKICNSIDDIVYHLNSDLVNRKIHLSGGASNRLIDRRLLK